MAKKPKTKTIRVHKFEVILDHSLEGHSFEVVIQKRAGGPVGRTRYVMDGCEPMLTITRAAATGRKP